jgi:hypothetical protein
MIVNVYVGSVVVDEPQRFDRLSVAVADGAPRCGPVGELGHFAEGGEDAWLDPEALRRAAGADTELELRKGFDRMVAYAVSKGWVGENGRLRAHVEERTA